jgi:hypothetical protein
MEAHPRQQTQKPSRDDFGKRFRAARSFAVLFLLLLVASALAIGSSDSGAMRLLSSVFTGFTLVLAVRITRAPRLYARLAWLGLALAVAAGSMGEIVHNAHVPGVVLIVITFELALSVLSIIQSLAKHTTVTTETVAGALCIYLLAGMIFGSVLNTLSVLGGHDYLIATAAAHGAVTRGDYYYFSFVTMTTTGYGDVVAANGSGRALAIVEAVVGQVYLVTTVAWLVSTARPRRARTTAQPDGERSPV